MTLNDCSRYRGNPNRFLRRRVGLHSDDLTGQLLQLRLLDAAGRVSGRHPFQQALLAFRKFVAGLFHVEQKHLDHACYDISVRQNLAIGVTAELGLICLAFNARFFSGFARRNLMWFQTLDGPVFGMVQRWVAGCDQDDLAFLAGAAVADRAVLLQNVGIVQQRFHEVIQDRS
jgi:hypothetical protein